jgi:Carbohydrate-selective porin, OprB family
MKKNVIASSRSASASQRAAIMSFLKRALLTGAVACVGAVTSAQAQVTGQFQRAKGVIEEPTELATDFMKEITRDWDSSYDSYSAWKKSLATNYGLTFAMQTSYFLQSATPDGGKPVSLFVWTPSVTWTPYDNSTWGTGQVNVAFQRAQYWSGANNASQQARIGTITGTNDWGSNAYTWLQATFTQTLPGALHWLSITGGQYGFGNFDGDRYAGNAQTNFVTYALAQNPTLTYPFAGVGAYATAAIPNTAVSISSGFQGATDIAGKQFSTRGYDTGQIAYFGNILWAPTLPTLGAGSYNVIVYHQPSVPLQPGQSTGVSFAMSQSMGPKYGVFARANYASGDVIAMQSSVGGGGIVNDPFGRHPNDQLALGLFLNKANQALLPTTTNRNEEHGAELYYRYTIAKGLQLTPDVAVIANPILAPQRPAEYLFTLRLTSFL